MLTDRGDYISADDPLGVDPPCPTPAQPAAHTRTIVPPELQKNSESVPKYCRLCGSVIIQSIRESRFTYSKRVFCSRTCAADFQKIGKYDDHGNRRCTRCEKFLPLSKFSHGRGYCRKCRNDDLGKSGYRKVYKDNIEHKLTKLCYGCKTRAKEKRVPFNLTPQMLIDKYHAQGGKCYWSGLDLTNVNGLGYTGSNYNISVDRVEPSLGYVRDNVVLVCRSINTMKGTLSEVEFRSIISTIHSHLSSK